MAADQPLLNSASPLSESSKPASIFFGSAGGNCQPAPSPLWAIEESNSICLNNGEEEEEEVDPLEKKGHLKRTSIHSGASSLERLSKAYGFPFSVSID